MLKTIEGDKPSPDDHPILREYRDVFPGRGVGLTIEKRHRLLNRTFTRSGAGV
jgi:hypothetical protein